MGIRVDDVLTYRNRKDFSSAVAVFKESASRQLIINLHEATYVVSAAIGLLGLTSQQVVAPQGTVRQVLELSHIDRMIPMFPTEEAAARQQPA